MRTTSIARTVIGLSLVVAPVLNLVSALYASAALAPDSRAEIVQITAHPTRFYLYAITQLVGAYLLIPAFIGVKNLMRDRSPRWADLAGGAVLLAFLVAIGDGATELMYWNMGAPGANLDQMVALADRYQNAAGSSLPYALGGVTLLVGSIALAIGLWRSKAAPAWAALCIPASMFANVFGYASGSQALLIASALLLLAGFTRIAAIVLSRTGKTLATVVSHEVEPVPVN
jgi:hypothetical protein